MNAVAIDAILVRAFIRDRLSEAVSELESLPAVEAAAALAAVPRDALPSLFGRLAPDVAAALLERLDPAARPGLVTALDMDDILSILGQMEADQAAALRAAMPAPLAADLVALDVHAEDSVGRVMDRRFAQFRPEHTVAEAQERLRANPETRIHNLFLAGPDNVLSGRVWIQDVAAAAPDTRLGTLMRPLAAAVQTTATREEVVDLLETRRIAELPVVDRDGRLVGVVRQETLFRALQEDATVDIQTMVGASKDERALSKPMFAVRKRLPWLHINLLTAFMAAAVVGLFEETIAQFTALAVLLPVVAGQSGNAGAQALAVTMRGLALREITVRSWLAVTIKEVRVGMVNGVAVALTTSIGVYLWSGSFGLALVIASSMILAMVAAGFAGAVVPIILTRVGQDPATASSIVLTTVTDIAGFFSFLGIATLLSALL